MQAETGFFFRTYWEKKEIKDRILGNYHSSEKGTLIKEAGNGAIVAVCVSVTRFTVILDILALRSFVRGRGNPPQSVIPEITSVQAIF